MTPGIFCRCNTRAGMHTVCARKSSFLSIAHREFSSCVCNWPWQWDDDDDEDENDEDDDDDDDERRRSDQLSIASLSRRISSRRGNRVIGFKIAFEGISALSGRWRKCYGEFFTIFAKEAREGEGRWITPLQKIERRCCNKEYKWSNLQWIPAGLKTFYFTIRAVKTNLADVIDQRSISKVRWREYLCSYSTREYLINQ